MARLHIPDDLREFLRAVDERLQAVSAALSVDGDDAFVGACALGGRLAGEDDFLFTYYPQTGGPRRLVRLSRSDLTAVGSGQLTEVETLPLPRTRPKRATAHGDALCVWGPHAEDSCWLRRPDETGRLVDALHARAGQDGPIVFHLWSPREDLLAVALAGDDASLQVVWSDGKFATSRGNPNAGEPFEATDPDGRRLRLSRADCIPWRTARLACLRFAAEGELSADLPVQDKIRADLVVQARAHREGVVAERGQPAHDLAASSLGVPTTQGGRRAPRANPGPPRLVHRLLALLVDKGLVELTPDASAEELLEALEDLVDDQGEAALRSLEAAEDLADALSELPGVEDVYATAIEVQHVLREAAGL